MGLERDGLLYGWVPGVAPGVYPVQNAYAETLCLGFPTPAFIRERMDPRHRIRRMPPATCDKEGQVGARLLGPTFGFAYTCRSCVCNAVNAVAARHGARQPLMTHRFRQYPTLERALTTAYLDLDHVYYDSWIDKWPATRRAKILHSVEFDEVVPEKVSAFIKRESGQNKPTKARLIQGYRTLATQEMFGREFTIFQKALAFVLGPEGFELRPGIFATFGSGLNGVELGRWMTDAVSSYRNPTFYERDGKNWDATMQDEHQRLKIGIMTAVKPALGAFAQACYKVEGKFMGKFGILSYVLDGTVKSGHNDTSSGNSLINAVLTAEALELAGLRGRFIVAGDDMLAVIDGDYDFERLLAAERTMGIIPEARKFYDACDTSFISGCFLRSTDGAYGFFPNLGRLLSRLWWTTKHVTPSSLNDHVYSIACGLYATIGHLPVYGGLIAAQRDRGGTLVDVGKFKHTAHTASVSGDYVPCLAHRYGCSVEELYELDAFIRSAGTSPCYLVHPLFDVIALRDLSDIHDRSPVAATTLE